MTAADLAREALNDDAKAHAETICGEPHKDQLNLLGGILALKFAATYAPGMEKSGESMSGAREVRRTATAELERLHRLIARHRTREPALARAVIALSEENERLRTELAAFHQFNKAILDIDEEAPDA